MANLNSSQTYSPGSIPIYEKYGRLHFTSDKNVDINYSQMLPHYPKIQLSNESLMHTNDFSLDERGSMWDSVVYAKENIIKRLTRIYFRSGWSGIYQEIQSPEILVEYPKMKILLNAANTIINYFKKSRSFCFFLNRKECTEEEVAKYAETGDWFNGKIRFICWHPDFFKFALVCCDDSIRIYNDHIESQPTILKNNSQRWVSCIAWRSCTAFELVVGCQEGLCHWISDEFNRFTINMNFYTQPNHAPISSLQWNSDATLLATASINDNNIIIWNIDEGSTTVLYRIGPNFHLLRWSVDESALFGATVGKVFRIWATNKHWECERWTTKIGHIQSACWSPCSSFILFVTSEESQLYRMQCSEKDIFQKSESIISEAVPVADLSQFMYRDTSIGRKPLTLERDPTGSYLAVIFKDKDNVIVFNTKFFNHSMLITPNCIIEGRDVEYPLCIAFQSINNANTDIVLTIGWSSGRLQYFPFFKN